MSVVKIIDPLDATLQIFNPLLNLDDCNVEGAMADLLILEASLHGQHLLLKLLDVLVLAN